MDKRGVGVVPGRVLSAHRVQVLEHLENSLRGLEFPASREKLCRFLEGITIPLGADGQQVQASNLVGSIPVDEFSSPAHVREAVNINWEDFADVYGPGGTKSARSDPVRGENFPRPNAHPGPPAPLRESDETTGVGHQAISTAGEAGRDHRQIEVTGLLGSVGKSIASQAKSDNARERLKRVDSPETFRSVLEELDLGVAPEATRQFIDAVTKEDWHDYHRRLLRSVDIAFHERYAPSS